MNSYQKKLQEKRAYQHHAPGEKKGDLKRRKAYEHQHTKKNAQFGMF